MIDTPDPDRGSRAFADDITVGGKNIVDPLGDSPVAYHNADYSNPFSIEAAL